MADEEKKPPKSSGTAFIIGLVVVTLVAAGGGVGLSMLSPPSQGSKHAAKSNSHAPEKEKNGSKHSDETKKSFVLVPMQPIITNIGKKKKTLIRIESVLVVKADHSDSADYMVEQVTEDILTFLKSISLSDLEGSFGFVNFMEDLNVRVAARTKDQVSEILIQSLVVE